MTFLLLSAMHRVYICSATLSTIIKLHRSAPRLDSLDLTAVSVRLLYTYFRRAFADTALKITINIKWRPIFIYWPPCLTAIRVL